ncbi:MAG: proline dehydrogenase family protein, partial [Planctomycetota bacterium]|nr:proline dehydrogenase family protein [Planctomycetota bacterium]
MIYRARNGCPALLRGLDCRPTLWPHMQDNPTQSLEPSIRRIGREIFERAEAAAPSVLSMEFWQKATLDWLTRDDDLKLRLFRFIEVFPALRTDASVARHLKEYLGDEKRAGGPLPLPIQAALAFKREDSPYAQKVAAITRIACARMARQFVCGATPKEAVASVKRLRRAGMAFTLDVLGETVIGDHVAQAHYAVYMRLIDELSRVAPAWKAAPTVDNAPWGPLPRVNISTKLTSLVTKFDSLDAPAATANVLDRLRPLFRAARDRGVFINIDTEHYAVKDRTFDIVLGVLDEPEFRDWPDCGLVIQAYLSDAGRDLARVLAWARKRGTPVTVRLVKGAYWDFEVIHSILTGKPCPVFIQKPHSDAEFERLARIMLENADVIRPAFASHNVRSIAAVLAMERALDRPPRTLELQMLTGMGDPLKRAVVGLEQR